MKCITFSRLLLIVAVVLFYQNYIIAQGFLVEIPLEQQVQNSELIVEGRIIHKESFWDTNKNHIYTKNVIEVYKIFKGQTGSRIEVLTIGGVVGDKAEKVTPSLSLSKNTVGMLFLSNTDIKGVNESGNQPRFKSYAGKQGFYQYDIERNTVHNAFRSFDGIEDIFYDKIKSITKLDYKEISPMSFKKRNISNQVSKGQLIVGINNISPSTISAGTGSILTINGSGFGDDQGTVEFNHASLSGAPLFEPLPTQIISWKDDKIEVEVPDDAGTGVVRVSHLFNGTFDEENLTISFAQINIIADNATPGTDYAYQTQHTDDDGGGGYTFNMFIGFTGIAGAEDSFNRALESWRCQSGVNWIQGSTEFSIDAANRDGTNIIRFDNGTELQDVIMAGAGTLGVSLSYFSLCWTPGDPSSLKTYVDEIDTVFDDDTNWQFGPALAGSGEVDFESVALHELGHGHQLGHVIDNSVVMHRSIGSADNRRILSPNDISGANDVFNRSSTVPEVCGEGLMTAYTGNCSLSTNEEELVNNITIHPNPNNGEFYIQKTFNINLNRALIYDMSGRLVLEQDLSGPSNTKTINLKNGISSGVYFANIQSDLGAVTKRLVLK